MSKKQRCCPNFYFSYYGNKRKEVAHFNNIDFDKYDIIIEAFAGSGAVSRWLYICKGLKNKTYILNDTDTEYINFLKYVKENGSSKLYDYANETLKDMTKEKWRAITNKKDKTPEEYFFSRKATILGGMYPLRIEGKEFKKREIDNDEFFKAPNVILTNEDYKTVIGEYINNPKVLIFFDPPYLESYNAEYSINEKQGYGETIVDNTSYYIDILKMMSKATAGILMIINSNSLMDYVYRDYIKKTYDYVYQIAKTKVRHHIVGNINII
jgi:site-specific DNA-adenine methylase